MSSVPPRCSSAFQASRVVLEGILCGMGRASRLRRLVSGRSWWPVCEVSDVSDVCLCCAFASARSLATGLVNLCPELFYILTSPLRGGTNWSVNRVKMCFPASTLINYLLIVYCFFPGRQFEIFDLFVCAQHLYLEMYSKLLYQTTMYLPQELQIWKMNQWP